MRILVDIGHPAHVHYFKNLMWEMAKKGHEFLITARDRGIVFHLLDIYGFDYLSRGKGSTNALGKVLGIPKTDFFIYNQARKFNPDLFLSFGSMYAAHASKLLGKPHIAFDDTEHSRIEHILYLPFTDLVCTPEWFGKDFGKKHIRFDGFMESTYLHPNYYKPDPKVLDEVGISEGDTFFVLRFVSWEAVHDISHGGASEKQKRELVDLLRSRGRVLITSESRLPKELEGYKCTIAPEKIHDLLHYATMYVGEGATMATESALLGTPATFINSLANTMGNLNVLEENGLVAQFKDSGASMKHLEGIDFDKKKMEHVKKSVSFTNSKVDVTKWMMDLLEGGEWKK